MVAERFSHALMRFAARRWSNPDEMLREWSAELHELASKGRRGEMVRFTLSLALSRRSVAAMVMDRRFWTAAAVLLLTPFLAILLPIPAIIGSLLVASEDSTFWSGLIGEWSFWLSTTVQYLITAALAITLAVLARRRAHLIALISPFWLTIAVWTPMAAAFLLGLEFLGGSQQAETLIWLAGMLPTLWAACILARNGKQAAAWLAGMAGTLVGGTLAVAAVTGNPWHFYTFFNYRGGTPYSLGPMPMLILLLAPYALAVATKAARLDLERTLTPRLAE